MPSVPVECGPYSCKFDNTCEALRNGWKSEECCGVPLMVSICSAEYDPVICGQKPCWYSNQCIASTVDWAAEKCKRHDCPWPHNAICDPSLDEPVKCVGDTDQYKKDCVYRNMCYASAGTCKWIGATSVHERAKTLRIR